jgi:hypothetical protein
MIGDINGDNVDDVAIGDPASSLVYIYFGSKQTFAVSSGGDVNGDGVIDVLIGIEFYEDDDIGAVV